jgi:glutathione reductase (NADPH)
MRNTFDYIVIGAGSAGVRFARLMSNQGKKVCIVEKSRVGGTCVIRGCVPKKLYVYASNFTDQLSDATSFGWNLGGVAKHDWGTLVANKNKEIDRLNQIYIRNLSKAGVLIIEDEARFVSSNSVQLQNSQRILQAKKIIITTGSTPSMPDIPGKELAISSDQFFELRKLPKKISIVGSGYIALEFAFLLRNLHYDVSLIIRKKTILNEFDPDIGARILESAKRKKIKIYDERSVVALVKKNKNIQIKTTKGMIASNLVIFATGRVPCIQGLQLDNAGVKVTKAGSIKVNKYSQTSNKNIFALGDVTNRKNLTPVAIREAVYLVNHLTKKTKQTLHYHKIASAVFTQPEVGHIGYGEHELQRKQIQYKILQTQFRPMKYSFSKKENPVFIKVLYRPVTEEILGIIYIGESAAEIIQSIAIAFSKKFTLNDLRLTVPVHPTSAEELVTLV